TTGMLTSLQTLIDDPVEKALAIGRYTDAAKEHFRAYGLEMMHDWAELSAPYWGKLFQLYSRLRLADRHAVMHNLVISNMGGRFRDLSFAGARITSFVPFGAPMDGGALFAAIASIDDQFSIGLAACPEIIPDLPRIADYIDDAFVELAEAVDRRSASHAG
ncbi:MAG TPA: WS/DGAT domain-containing protein, partial [Mycobacterium sp.]|nr:WS/DGAT domain-containing protein [Mycobacterium sp.]